MKPGNDKETRARDFVRPIWGRENLLYWTRNWLPKNEYVFQLFWEASLFISYSPVSTARTLSQTFINFALPYRKLMDPHLRAPHWYMRLGRRYSFKGSSNSSAWKQECFFCVFSSSPGFCGELFILQSELSQKSLYQLNSITPYGNYALFSPLSSENERTCFRLFLCILQ